MIPLESRNQITKIWDKYIFDNKIVKDVKGNVFDDIDSARHSANEKLRNIVADFISGNIVLTEFKTLIDSFNKQNNLWGFTSIKGQMFFNLLSKTADGKMQVDQLSILLRTCVSQPRDLEDAASKIKLLEDYVVPIFNTVPDKRKAPNPGSIGYFLSYFWQIHDAIKWPIMYSSFIVSLSNIGVWHLSGNQSEAYKVFFGLNEEIKQLLSEHAKKNISNWEAEHAFWNFRTIKVYPKKEVDVPIDIVEEIKDGDQLPNILNQASFDIYSYLPRLVEDLIKLGAEIDVSAATKGSKFEKLVAEIFKLLGFSVSIMGQGHRDPDLIAVHREDNVAFIIDAKAYTNGYGLSATDERAIREYISHHCPQLKRDGIQRIGFILVSNAFKAGFDDFINEMTWKTDVKRFVCLSSNALLHLLAYRIKDQKPLSEIVDALISLGTLIRHQDIVKRFDDV